MGFALAEQEVFLPPLPCQASKAGLPNFVGTLEKLRRGCAPGSTANLITVAIVLVRVKGHQDEADLCPSGRAGGLN